MPAWARPIDVPQGRRSCPQAALAPTAAVSGVKRRLRGAGCRSRERVLGHLAGRRAALTVGCRGDCRQSSLEQEVTADSRLAAGGCVRRDDVRRHPLAAQAVGGVHGMHEPGASPAAHHRPTPACVVVTPSPPAVTLIQPLPVAGRLAGRRPRGRRRATRPHEPWRQPEPGKATASAGADDGEASASASADQRGCGHRGAVLRTLEETVDMGHRLVSKLNRDAEAAPLRAPIATPTRPRRRRPRGQEPRLSSTSKHAR
jgi:hypothetical protein